jgi:4-hydroxybenzoate polyprenyltransferase
VHRGSLSPGRGYGERVFARLFHIARPVLWINTIGTTVVGMWLTGTLWSWEIVPLLLWATLPFNLLIYGLNDIFDQETDAHNARKGGIEGARIHPSETRLIVTGIVLTNLPFLAYFVVALPGTALAWIAVYIVVFVAYSAPPLRFKARRYLDSLSNAGYALPLVFVPLALGAVPVWAAALGLMAWSVAKHTYDAVQDIVEDRAVGIHTTAVRLEVRGSLVWSGTWWAISTVAFALISWPVALANALIAGGLIIALARQPTHVRAHELYRYSIVFPYAAGSVAGSHLVAAILLGTFS